MNWFCNEGLTGTDDGRSLIHQCPDVIDALLKLTSDNEGTVARDALLAIVNLSADEAAPEAILQKVKFSMFNTSILTALYRHQIFLLHVRNLFWTKIVHMPIYGQCF